MYLVLVYLLSYLVNHKTSTKGILLYPKNMYKINLPKYKLLEEYIDKIIEIKTVRLDSVENTVEDLKNILKDL